MMNFDTLQFCQHIQVPHSFGCTILQAFSSGEMRLWCCNSGHAFDYKHKTPFEYSIVTLSLLYIIRMTCSLFFLHNFFVCVFFSAQFLCVKSFQRLIENNTETCIKLFRPKSKNRTRKKATAIEFKIKAARKVDK